MTKTILPAQIFVSSYASPIGTLVITGSSEKIYSVLFQEGTEAENDNKLPNIFAICKQELAEYFAGTRKIFTVPYEQPGTTFQQQVWKSLESVPYGETWSYSHQAQSIQRPKAVRAIGGTNGKNQLTIIVPCHRVIGKDGSLTGYGGEIWRKKWLLEHERKFKISD